MPEIELSEPTEEQMCDALVVGSYGMEYRVEKIAYNQLKVIWQGTPFVVHVYKEGSIWHNPDTD